MRFAAVIIAVLLPISVWAQDSVDAKRVAIVVAIHRPSSAFESVPNAHESAAALVEVLGSKAGYTDVRGLIGPVASASTVLDTVRSAMRDIGQDGFLLFVYVGHGVGGDFGEPALMTHGASVRDPLETGLDVVDLSEALSPSAPQQQILVAIDAAHLGNVDGVALIGPKASEWPQVTSSGLAVITPNPSAIGSDRADIVSVLTEAFAGAADTDSDGHVRLTELFRWMGTSLSDSSGSFIDMSGVVSSDRSVAVVQGQPVVSEAKRSWRGLSKILVISGGSLGAASMSMYAAKRGQCEGDAGDLRCGYGDKYHRYQRAQHALGAVSVGLVLAGVGVQLMPTTNSMSIGLQGSF